MSDVKPPTPPATPESVATGMEDKKLEDMIDSALSQLGFGADTQRAMTQVRCAVTLQEKRQKDVNQIFSDCQSMIEKFKNTIAGNRPPEEEPVKIDSESSDDDVQFVQTTFDPTLVKTGSQGQDTGSPGQAVNRGATSVQLQAYQVRNSSGQLVTQYYLPPGADGRPTLPAQVLQQAINQQPQNLRSIVRDPGIRMAPAPRILQHPPKHPDLVVGQKLFGKKNNDVWYKGTLVDILNNNKPRPERKYKLKFDYRGMKSLIGKQVAFTDTPTDIMSVGCRVIGKYVMIGNTALYKDDQGGTSYYAGIVAEPPTLRNNHRYLVFFDDGYAQYCAPNAIHQIFEQSVNVWEDTYKDSQAFIKSYLQQYPERPMVRLQKGQMVKTEWNGNWWVAKVQEVDASLVKMHFEADRRVEWIYRGSTRLEPLYTELAQQEASKQMSRAGRRHHLHSKSHRKPLVEYTRSDSIDPTQKKSVAKKSSTKKPQTPPVMGKGGKDMASMLQERLSSDNAYADGEAHGEMVEVDKSEILKHITRKIYEPHQCNHLCIKHIDDNPEKFKGDNPLLIPTLTGWERQVTKQKSAITKRGVIYRAPCGRRLRHIGEIDQYLRLTDAKLTIDLFCFDPALHTDIEYMPCKTFCDIKDLSYGKESVPISCVNGIDRSYPEYVEYSNQRTPAKGVKLNLGEEFLTCCDCTDGCRDKTKCQCIQMTIEAAKANPQYSYNLNETGYSNRRLQEPLVTGIYECNSRCKCDKRCCNRVVQNGLGLRLQVFKTEKRGWGIRCNDDIPEGGFICIYAGQLLTEQGANEDGQAYGDEYLAELDYIEVVERSKEGYESDANEDEGIGKEEKRGGHKSDSDDDFAPADDSDSDCSVEKQYTAQEKRKKKKGTSDDGVHKLVLQRESLGKEAWAVKSNAGSDVMVISDDEDSNQSGGQTSAKDNGSKDNDGKDNDSKDKDGKGNVSKDKDSKENGGKDNDNKDNSSKDNSSKDNSSKDNSSKDKENVKAAGDLDKSVDGIGELQITEATSLNTDNVEMESEDSDKEHSKDGLTFKRATRSGSSRFKNLPDPTSQKAISPLKKPDDDKKGKKKEDKSGDEGITQDIPDTRLLFGEEFCYVMDAKSMGNIGRYLNHSCSPNVFVQNVFVDTHDLRFPWVAFFAAQHIRAGTELTWDYNYEVGSVPGKILYCYCGSAECRGRLL